MRYRDTYRGITGIAQHYLERCPLLALADGRGCGYPSPKKFIVFCDYNLEIILILYCCKLKFFLA